MILYRGGLKSCNYSCTYCPFSKHGIRDGELEQDRKQWFSFVQRITAQGEQAGIRGLMLAPYGEAMIYPWYWEGLAQLSMLPWIDAVGSQTNLSFPADASLERFTGSGGVLSKLRLWATFHPQMTTMDRFAGTCRQLAARGVRLCAGAVGVPEQAGLLLQLREELPDAVYLWINRMDGLGRGYTQAERQAFSKIDPYFYRELLPHPSDVSQCRTRLFAEGDGRFRLCNLSQAWKAQDLAAAVQEEISNRCTRKRCSCYLAYGGRTNLINQMLFGPWPLFRIPRRPKAVFLDIEGTLLTRPPRSHRSANGRKTGQIAAEVRAALEVLVRKEKTLLFFATTLPYQDARKRCRSIWHLCSGGVFAAGGHIMIEESRTAKKEWFVEIPKECPQMLEKMKRKKQARMLVYGTGKGACYKITLLHPSRRTWNSLEIAEVTECLSEPASARVRILTEGHCLQIVAAEADKAAGVRKICSWLKIPLHQIFAAGDSKEDAKMMELEQKNCAEC